MILVLAMHSTRLNLALLLASAFGCMPYWCLWELLCTLAQLLINVSQGFTGPYALCNCGVLLCGVGWADRVMATYQ